MTRWITSDHSTTAALRGRQMEATAGSAEPLSDALSANAAVLLLPVASGDVLVARFRRRAEVEPSSEPAFDVARWSDKDAVGYTAGGMLGLFDEPVYEEEKQEPPKKRWWQRSSE
jgi:hypothetical protein